MKLTAAQRKALEVLDEGERIGVRVYLSNVNRAGAVATATATSLEAAGLAETEDVGRISETWIAHLTDAGREALVEARIAEADDQAAALDRCAAASRRNVRRYGVGDSALRP